MQILRRAVFAVRSGGSAEYGAVGSVPVCVVFAVRGSAASGLAALSAGIVCAGLSILMFCGCRAAVKGLLALTGKGAVWVKKSLYQKGGSAMKKATKVWLITAAALVLAGCILFAGVMSVLGWDFKRLSTVRYETNLTEVSEAFSEISVTTETADVTFLLSDDGKCSVECYEAENAVHSVRAADGVLTIELNDQRSWQDHIGVYFGSPAITVRLPRAEYDALRVSQSTGKVTVPEVFSFGRADISAGTGSVSFSAAARETVKIRTSTGDICVENTAVGGLDLSAVTGRVTVSDVKCAGDAVIGVSTGEVCLTDAACRSLVSSGTTGDILLERVAAAEKLSIERSTGNVRFDGSDAAELFIRTNTGNVAGSLLTDKIFLTQTDTGDVEVPQTAAGGKCEIRTDTGEIKMEIGRPD